MHSDVGTPHRLVVWNMFFSIVYGNNHPNWLIFFKMVKTTNQFIIWIHLWNLRYINISPYKNRRLTSSHSNRLSFEADPVSIEIQIVSWVRSYDNCEAPKSFWLIPYEPKDCVFGWSRPLNREVVGFGCQNKKQSTKQVMWVKQCHLHHPSVITIFL